MPSSSERRVYHDDILALLRKLDDALEGMQRKVKLYGVGGTIFVLSNLRDSSKDIDFIVSRQDHRALSSHVAELARREKVRIDLFPDGDLPDYKYDDYATHAKKAPFDFRNLDLYFIDTTDLVLTKALAGRQHDVQDLDRLDITKVPLDELRARYQKIVPDSGKEQLLKSKFEKFVEKYYEQR